MSRIYYTKPSITELEIAYATDAATNGWGARCYEYISRFEQAFREHLGVKHAIATSSCTGASHMGLAALGVGSGDEVILGDTNWIASAAPVTYLGAKPVFVDVLPDTWCIDPAAAEAAITSRTKAIIAVHLYGNLCDMDALRALGARHSIPIIEDAAEAIGSTWHGLRAGSMGVFGTFSFHGTKTVTTGEGGMFVTQDDALFEKVLTLSNHGRARGQTKQFWPDTVGFKYKMSNLQAAIGCAQMERIDSLIAAKRRIFNYYEQQLRDLPLRMNPEPPGTRNGFWMPTIVADASVSFDREALLRTFKSQEIDGRVFFWPLSMLPAFAAKPENVVSYSLYERALNLPTYHDLTEAEMDRVVACVRQRSCDHDGVDEWYSNLQELLQMNEIVERFYAERKRRIAGYGAVRGRYVDVVNDLTRLDYEYNFDMFGRPVIQMPQDVVAMQELIWRIKPDLIIETGVAHGGSLMLSAGMLALLDYSEAVLAGKTLDPRATRRRVVGIDIDIRAHNREAIEVHPLAHLIELIQGSSTAPDIVQRVRAVAAVYDRVLVCLDSNHTHDHVLAELEVYAPLVSKGSYCCVFDTAVEDMPAELCRERPWGQGNSPRTAVWEYLRLLKDEGRLAQDGAQLALEIDQTIDSKLLITVAPDGYLRRI